VQFEKWLTSTEEMYEMYAEEEEATLSREQLDAQANLFILELLKKAWDSAHRKSKDENDTGIDKRKFKYSTHDGLAR